MSTTDDRIEKFKLSRLASTLSNEEFQEFIICKTEWFVQKKKLMIDFFVNNDDANDIEKDISKINQIIRNRNNNNNNDNNNNNTIRKKTKISSLDELPDVLICEIATFLCIKGYFSFVCTAKIFVIALNNKNGTYLSKLKANQNWSNEQLKKHLDRHRNLQELDVFTDQLIDDEDHEIDFKLKKLRNLSLEIREKTVNFSHKAVIESKYWEYQNIVTLSLHFELDEGQQDIMQIRHILAKCNDLSSLYLFDFDIETSQTIKWIMNDDDIVLPQLVELNLRNSVGFALIIKFAHQLKKLRWYNIWHWSSRWYPISHSERFNHLKKCNFNQLQKLSVSAMHYNDMDGILTTAINLKKIEMTNDDHYYQDKINKTLKDLVKLIFMKCKKLIYFELNFVEMKTKGRNSDRKAYDGIIEGLQDTKQVQRAAFIIKLNLLLSLEHLTEIIKTFKLSKTKKMVLYFKGWLYHDFECTTLDYEKLNAYKELDYKKEKPFQLVNDMLEKLFDDDEDESKSFDLIDLKKDNQHCNRELEIKLTLMNEK